MINCHPFIIQYYFYYKFHKFLLIKKYEQVHILQQHHRSPLLHQIDPPLSSSTCKKLTTEAVTSTYKKVCDKINNKINTEGKIIMGNKTALNRMFINCKNNCFITLKEHKANFLNSPKTSLLNAAKNELGRISKEILDKINVNLWNATKVNQWKNTNDVISWFKSIKNQWNCKFISFDIKHFYCAITEELLLKCLSFAETKV